MANFRDPKIALKHYLVLKSFHHTTGGIYIWEYFTTLGYEFDIIRGRRPHRWTTWIYTLTRTATLMTVILGFLVLNSTTPINCQLWITSDTIFGYLGIVTASLLIVLRVIAIWKNNKSIVSIAISLWVVCVAARIQGIARIRSHWLDSVSTCAIVNSHSSKLNFLIGLTTDIALLLIMLVGLLLFRSEAGGTCNTRDLLWNQGVAWLFLATAAEVPPTVLITLNLNDPLNLMFQVPVLIVMTIAATRMYRSLTDFNSAITKTDRICDISELKWNQPPVNQIQVTVDPSHELDQMSRTNHHGMCISTEPQPCNKTHEHEPRGQQGESA